MPRSVYSFISSFTLSQNLRDSLCDYPSTTSFEPPTASNKEEKEEVSKRSRLDISQRRIEIPIS